MGPGAMRPTRNLPSRQTPPPPRTGTVNSLYRSGYVVLLRCVHGSGAYVPRIDASTPHKPPGQTGMSCPWLMSYASKTHLPHPETAASLTAIGAAVMARPALPEAAADSDCRLGIGGRLGLDSPPSPRSLSGATCRPAGLRVLRSNPCEACRPSRAARTKSQRRG